MTRANLKMNLLCIITKYRFIYKVSSPTNMSSSLASCTRLTIVSVTVRSVRSISLKMTMNRADSVLVLFVFAIPRPSSSSWDGFMREWYLPYWIFHIYYCCIEFYWYIYGHGVCIYAKYLSGIGNTYSFS